MSEGERALTIDVVSDVVCPWCYLGKRRLALALAQEDGGPVAVRWRPFQLDPSIPAGGIDRRAYLTNKFPDDKRLDEVHAELVERLRAVTRERGDFAGVHVAPSSSEDVSDDDVVRLVVLG